ncbi:MAG: AsmA-like C-terminal region-containing protein, partial [Alphaproteobacteria bacterium]
DAVIFRGGVVHQVRLSAELAEGEVTLSQATARLPGGSQVSVFGFLTAAEGKPRFEGSVEAVADNLRGGLDWLQIDVSSVPPDRLRKFSFTGELSTSPETVRLTGIDLGLDTSRLTGGVTIALRERPAFGASLAIDRLNLDAYLPRPPAPDGQAAEDAAAEEPARPEAPPPSALALLATFDANLEARIDRLTYHRTPVQGVGFDGTLQAGTLTVREARVGDLAGASARASGTLSGFTGTPRLEADFELRADDLTGLFRLTGVAPPVAPQKLGNFVLEGSAETDGTDATFDLQLALAGGGASLGGELKGLDGTPSYDLEVKASHPDAARLLETFLEGARLPGDRLGDIGLAARLRGDGSTGQDVALDGEIALLGGTVGAAGRLAVPGGAPSYDLELDARFPSLARLVGAFMPAFRAAREDLGGFQLDAALEGDASGLRLSGIKGAAGPVALGGDIAVRLDGPRPKVSAAFNTGEIVLDQLLPAPEEAAATGGQGAATGGGEVAAAQDRRWSREPLDLKALEGFDAELVLTAPALSYGAYRLDEPRLAATLTDGVLEPSRLSGVVFGGAFEADARLAVGRSNQINASLAVDGIELAKALPAVADTDRAAGPVSLKAVVATAGASLHDFIDSLNGSGALNGTVIVKAEAQERAGATALSFLGSLFELPELTTLGGALNGVITAFAEAPAALDGTFTIDRGVIRTSDTRLQGRGLQARLEGTAALVPWQMDMDLRVLRETDPPDNPVVIVRLTGPLDSPDIRVAGAVLSGGAREQSQQRQPEQLEQPEQPQPEQPALPSPADILKGILDSLGN